MLQAIGESGAILGLATIGVFDIIKGIEDYNEDSILKASVWIALGLCMLALAFKKLMA